MVNDEVSEPISDDHTVTTTSSARTYHSSGVSWAPGLNFEGNNDVLYSRSSPRFGVSRMSSSEFSRCDVPQHDLLTVFQSAPLIYTDATTGEPVPLETLNFDFERRVLTETIEEASRSSGKIIEVDFQIATTDRLSLFFAREEGQILHFSCHGHPSYLALEDGCGGMQALPTSQLKDWVDAVGGKNLHFVFVSACHSGLIGQAFVDAGVPHVVCCRHDSKIRESAAVEFEKTFYRNLAAGTKNLQQAFDIARQEILVSPRISVEHRVEEAAKFCLLPLGVRHDVPVFFRRQQSSCTQRRGKEHVPDTLFPLPPQVHIGREKEQFYLIQELLRCRFVRVSGENGVGKSHLVKKCCQYLNERLHLPSIDELDEIVWHTYPKHPIEVQSLPYSQVHQVFELIRNHNIESSSFLTHADRITQSLVHELSGKRTLLVLEAKEISTQSAADKLALLVYAIIDRTKYAKVLVIHRSEFQIKPDRLPCREGHRCVGRLGLEATVDLFELLLPNNIIDQQRHGVATSRQLCDLLLSSSTDLLTKRMQDIYRLIGGGIPLEIHRAAKNITPEIVNDLVALGRQSGNENELRFSSRVALTDKIRLVRRQISEAAAQRKFSKCQELQVVFDELEMQKAQLPDVNSLEKEFDKITFQLDLAASSMNWSKAIFLQGELDRLEISIQLERDLEAAICTDRSESEIERTRVATEEKIGHLNKDYETAFDEGNFVRAEEIDCESKLLKELLSQTPTMRELRLQITELKSELGVAKANRRFNAAMRIRERLVKVKAQLALEEQAQRMFRINPDLLDQTSSGPSRPVEVTSERSTGQNLEAAICTDRPEVEIERTRVAIEGKIGQLNKDYETAFDEGNFVRAEEIDCESKLLKELLSQTPTMRELHLQITELKSELDVAKANRSFHTAKRIHDRLVKVKAQLALEEQAQRIFRINPDFPDQTSRGARSPVEVTSQTSTGQNSVDPPGISLVDCDSESDNDGRPGALRVDNSNADEIETTDVDDRNFEDASLYPLPRSWVTSNLCPLDDEDSFLEESVAVPGAFGDDRSAEETEDHNVIFEAYPVDVQENINSAPSTPFERAELERIVMETIIKHAVQAEVVGVERVSCLDKLSKLWKQIVKLWRRERKNNLPV